MARVGIAFPLQPTIGAAATPTASACHSWSYRSSLERSRGASTPVTFSGACGTAVTPPCPNLQNPYIHDFGSILAFTEQNFNLQHIDLINNGYADYNALDWDSGHHTTPLSDFFSLYPGGRPFVFISATQSASFFQNYYATTGATPTGPDTD